jgi:hypothetical protein
MVQDSADSKPRSQGTPSAQSPAKVPRPGVDLIADAAKRALTLEEASKTLEQFRRLCASQEVDARLLEETAEKLRQAGYKQELGAALHEALTSANSHPQVGALWMRRLVASNTWNRRYPQEMDELCERGELGYRAVLEFLEVAGAKRKANLVRRAVRTHANWLRTDLRAWGVAARALVNAHCYRTAKSWMSDWRSRPELDLSLFLCLAFALRGSGQFKDGHEVVGLALARPGVDQFPIFKVWYAMEEALAGNIKTAATHFQELKPLAWDDDLLCRYYLARGVLRVQQAEKKNRREAFGQACERIKDRFRRIRVYQKEILLRAEYRRCVWRMGVDSGSYFAAVRAVWRSADSCFFMLLLLIVPGLQLFLPLYVFRLCRWRNGRQTKQAWS